jgi:dihydrofolate reductase
MRRIVMFNQVSADGYFADDAGSLEWVVPEPQLDREAAASLGESDTLLFGRRTYEMFERFWPHALDDSDTSPDPHAPGHRSPEIRAIAEWINASHKLVFSRTRGEVTWRNSQVVPELDPREIEEMKRQPGKNMMVMGSGSIVSQLTGHGLIDEYQFLVCPVVLGSGKPLMGGVAKSLKLDLQEAKSYPSGNVMLRYARKT